MIDLENKDVPLRLTNLSDLPHRIKKGTELAVCEPVCGVSITDDYGESAGHTRKTQVETNFPNHLKELYERSTTGLDATEKQVLCNLLCEFSTLFSQRPHDLGRTDLVKHHIHTGTAPPVRQPPRCFPLTKREEADSH